MGVPIRCDEHGRIVGTRRPVEIGPTFFEFAAALPDGGFAPYRPVGPENWAASSSSPIDDLRASIKALDARSIKARLGSRRAIAGRLGLRGHVEAQAERDAQLLDAELELLIGEGWPLGSISIECQLGDRPRGVVEAGTVHPQTGLTWAGFYETS